jgi:hypothetical protein
LTYRELDEALGLTVPTKNLFSFCFTFAKISAFYEEAAPAEVLEGGQLLKH